MKPFFVLLMLLTLNMGAQQNRIPVKYPSTQQQDISDQYFGKTITDPYRWLEDDNSIETKQWVVSQNKVTDAYLGQIPFRESVRKSLTENWNFVKYGNMFKEGEYYLFFKNDGLQNQSVLYIQKGLNGTPERFIDPNTLDARGTTSLGTVSFSRNQRYCAFSVSMAGSDWQEIRVMDMSNKKMIADVISHTKFTQISWFHDEGFYYSGYDKPSESGKYSAKTEFQKIKYHKLLTRPSEDIVVYEDKNDPLIYKGAMLSEDHRFLMLSLSKGTDGNELKFLDLQNHKAGFQMLSPGYNYNQDFIEARDGKFLVLTNQGAFGYKVVEINPAIEGDDRVRTVIPETKHKLDAVHYVGNKFICQYLVNAASKVEIYGATGEKERSVELPGLGTASGFSGSVRDNHTFFSFTSFNSPAAIYKLDLNSGETQLMKQTDLKSSAEIMVSQTWYKSKDGTEIPMFICHRKDLKRNGGPHPLLLYGYGGFNISLTPGFSVPVNYFIQQGGVYVVASLRGGGEFGESWHQAGMLANKQNVFDDFIAAAEYLIDKGITSKEKLAIHGRSNGGLLVGACMTQRPDLFKVALPGVGVLDMLRYHKFTVGWGWAVEYGSSDKPREFEYLIKYSPLHNIKKGTAYPATMITTADHDDRVVPAHSFKFAAALQQAQSGDAPALIRIDTQAGHGAGKPTTKSIDEWTDMLSFTMFHLGMNPKN